jgi:Flp pilus assembly protein TadB
MNQAQILFDSQHPNARHHLTKNFVVLISDTKHELNAHSNTEKDISGVRGFFAACLLLLVLALIVWMGVHVATSSEIVAILMLFTLGALVTTRTHWLYEPLKNCIRFSPISQSFPFYFTEQTFSVIHSYFPVNPRPPR